MEVGITALDRAARFNRERLVRCRSVGKKLARRMDRADCLVRRTEVDGRTGCRLEILSVAERIVCREFELRVRFHARHARVRVGIVQSENGLVARYGQIASTRVSDTKCDFTSRTHRVCLLILDLEFVEVEPHIQVFRPVFSRGNREVAERTDDFRNVRPALIEVARHIRTEAFLEILEILVGNIVGTGHKRENGTERIPFECGGTVRVVGIGELAVKFDGRSAVYFEGLALKVQNALTVTDLPEVDNCAGGTDRETVHQTVVNIVDAINRELAAVERERNVLKNVVAARSEVVIRTRERKTRVTRSEGV